MSRRSRACGSFAGSKFTKNEIDGLNVNSGPALIAMNGCPASVNEITSQSPDGVSCSTVAESMRDSGNTDT